jgi:hypothetical protein
MADNEWRSLASAPRDGTIVELECRYGTEPWYGLHRWTNERQAIDMQTGARQLCHDAPAAWVNAQDAAKALQDGPDLRWRRYDGTVAEYWRYPGRDRPQHLGPGELIIQTVALELPMPAGWVPQAVVDKVIARCEATGACQSISFGVGLFCSFQAGTAFGEKAWVWLFVWFALVVASPFLTPLLLFVVPRVAPMLPLWLRSRFNRGGRANGRAERS